VVKDLEKCIQFYGEVLGLETIERPALDFLRALVSGWRNNPAAFDGVR